jgi:hypothetical protein
MRTILLLMILATSQTSFALGKASRTDIPAYLKEQFDNANDPISFEDFPNAVTPEFPLTCKLWWNNKEWSPYNLAKHSRPVTSEYKPMGPLFPDNPDTDLKQGITWTTGRNKDQFDEIILNSKYTVTDVQITFSYSGYDTTLRKAGPYIFIYFTGNGTHYGYCWREKQ